MAYGGWILYQQRMYLSDYLTDTPWETGIIDPMIALIDSIPNWSVLTARTKYNSDSAWYAVLQHTSGAKLVLIWVGETALSATYILNTNYVDNTTLSGANAENSVYIAYLPPTVALGAGNPASSGFIPSTGFLIERLNAPTDDAIRNGWYWLHVLARDDDLILLWNNDPVDSNSADSFALLGSFLEPVHASDSGTRKNEGMYVRNNNFSGSDYTVQFFKADSTTRLVGSAEWTMISSSTPIQRSEMSYTGIPRWWDKLIAYKSGNPTTDGVVTGNGIKGTINQEWFFDVLSNAEDYVWQASSDGYHVKASQDYSFRFGWDISNPHPFTIP